MKNLWAVVTLSCLVLFSSACLAGDKQTLLSSISNCFHPFSDYVDGQLGESYSIGSHTRAADGTVRYRQPDNHVRRMPFQIQLREVDGDTMWRVLPDEEHDTGDFGPSASCAMRQWRSK
jgi:hypothetical protein